MTDSTQQFRTGRLCRTKACYEFWFRSASHELQPKQKAYSAEWEKEDSFWCHDREYKKGELVLIARTFVVLDEEDDDYGFIEVVMSDGQLGRMYTHARRSGQSIDCLLEPVDT